MLIDTAKTLVPHIRTSIQLGREFNAARDEFDRKTEGMPSIETMDLYYRQDGEVMIARNKLVQFLSQFTDEQVAIIRAVMYVGRNEKSVLLMRQEREDPEYMHDPEYRAMRRRAFESSEVLLKESFANVRHDSKDIAIDHMLEKVPFPDYLIDGMKVLRIA